ncbi:sulfur acquisition oxidoreductase SfnB family protein (plasmid) [Rhizobium gallicum bv. gallicum R602sp]|uniref:Sulfur acquisition oxidoreductase SfnB family protein n=1 Tax=Rhizobium gallicum bv. gallicum R602sp TaxID=1041138 RepID=A0A0B4X886_9HYPH|nr:SfnB family sulfur acquisition oxidoreductase [Rhizobium gallicum]AJD44214.1 sulfur acquisition oxidoreductase SfnB family protein [Rhizobium gallicum bv. gallicum R602sp]TDW25574.1 SfnB family sulfur acquisition oxidoreductase [Rhizobium azibense]
MTDRMIVDAEHSERLPQPPKKPHLITSDAEALDVAAGLAERFREGASDRDRKRQLPWDQIEEYTASGLGAITVPREFGGADVSLVTLARIFEVLCAADPSLGQLPQNQFGVLALLRDIGSPEQKSRIYADILNGLRIGNAGPEKGTKKVNVSTTRLTRTANGFRLSGRRFYSTGAIFAHWIPTRAIDEEDRAIQVWVRREAPGVRIIDDWSSFGQRTTASGTVEFNNVPVDPELVFPLWSFVKRAGLAGPISQLIQAAIDSGIAAAAITDTLSFVRERARPWVDFGGESASHDPTIIHEVGNLHALFHAAQGVLHRAAAVIDDVAKSPVTDRSSAEASVAVAEAKILTTEIALAATEMLFDLAGSSATRGAHNLDRHWRNARVHTLHDPVRWKYHLIGNYELNGTFPLRHQWN